MNLFDDQLHSFICDFVEGNLEQAEKKAFVDVINQNPEIKGFVLNAKQGRFLIRLYAPALRARLQPAVPAG